MELLINSVGFFAVVVAVIGFYAAILILAWQRLAQIRKAVRYADGPTGTLMSLREATRRFGSDIRFDIEERQK